MTVAIKNGKIKKADKKIRITKTVQSDLPFPPYYIVREGEVFVAWVNPLGAVSAEMSDGELLGVKPGEYEWIEPCKKVNMKNNNLTMYYGSENEGRFYSIGRFESPEEAVREFLKTEGDNLDIGKSFRIGWNLRPDKLKLDDNAICNMVVSQMDEWWEGTDVPNFKDIKAWCEENREAFKKPEDSFNKFFNLGHTGCVLNSAEFMVHWKIDEQTRGKKVAKKMAIRIVEKASPFIEKGP